MSGDQSIAIELLRGGRTLQMKLPDANTVFYSLYHCQRPTRGIDNVPSQCLFRLYILY
jgi:hypothetical protein